MLNKLKIKFSNKNSLSIKALLPRSLFGRFLMIIIVPTILVQLVAVYMFYERHWRSVSSHMQDALNGELYYIIKRSAELNEEQLMTFIHEVNSTMYLHAEFIPGAVLNKVIPEEAKDDELQQIKFYLENRTELPINISESDNNSEISVAYIIPAGLIKISFSTKRIANPSTYIFILWMSGTALVMLFVAIIFMRNQVKSITRLANAAEKFGKGIDIKKFKPEGAVEVRRAAEAFLNMKERIKKQIEQRTEMLAHVSHDLKTPLTRIKLQLAMMQDAKEVNELREDVEHMQKMVQGYLDFAKGKEHYDAEEINVSDTIRTIASGYRKHHQNIDLQLQSGVILMVNPGLFKRVITNIFDNGLRYGSRLVVRTKQYQKNLKIIIEDNGPGIPQKQRELVFKPFYRIDNSRNIDTGGTGLGLSITRDIVMGYGGDIKLGDSSIGGLKVVISFPL